MIDLMDHQKESMKEKLLAQFLAALNGEASCSRWQIGEFGSVCVVIGTPQFTERLEHLAEQLFNPGSLERHEFEHGGPP